MAARPAEVEGIQTIDDEHRRNINSRRVKGRLALVHRRVVIRELRDGDGIWGRFWGDWLWLKSNVRSSRRRLRGKHSGPALLFRWLLLSPSKVMSCDTVRRVTVCDIAAN